MVALRSRRLDSLLGARLEESIQAKSLRALVDARVAEDFDLDYKLDPYGTSDSERRKLATDVASMANAAGGLIIIGIHENDLAEAVDDPGVVIRDAEVSRMREIIASNVVPLPVVDIFPVRLSDEPGAPSASLPKADKNDEIEQTSEPKGFYLIAIPRSTLAPHAVRVNDALRFPIRHGRTSRTLAEWEIAAAYRSRAAGDTERRTRLHDIGREAERRLNRQSEPWLLVSLMPVVPGDALFTANQLHDRLQQYRGRQLQPLSIGASFSRVRAGHRRILIDGGLEGLEPGPQLAEFVSLELHTDGAGACAVRLERIFRPWALGEAFPTDAPFAISEESLVVSVVDGLYTLAKHTRDDAGTAGVCLLEARLILADEWKESKEFRLGHTRGDVPLPGLALRLLTLDADPPAATSEADLDDLCEQGPSLVTAASRLLADLFQMFGMVEAPQVTEDGGLRRSHWNSGYGVAALQWAEAHNIPLL